MLMLLCYVWAHLHFHSLRPHKFLTPISFILDEGLGRDHSMQDQFFWDLGVFFCKYIYNQENPRGLIYTISELSRWLGNNTKFNVFLLMIGALPIALGEYRARTIILKSMRDSLLMSSDIDGDQIHRFAGKIRYIFCIK